MTLPEIPTSITVRGPLFTDEILIKVIEENRISMQIMTVVAERLEDVKDKLEDVKDKLDDIKEALEGE